MSTEKQLRLNAYMKKMNPEQRKKASEYGSNTSFSQKFFPNPPVRHERNEEDYVESNKVMLNRYTTPK